jgi:RHS repeat-associated protein
VAVTDANGQLVPVSEQRYLPFGASREEDGITQQTDFGYTGQRSLAAAGLMDYNARWYDAALGRFVSADSLVPGAGNPQALNRFSYVKNNPLLLVDPSGNAPCGPEERLNCEGKLNVNTVNLQAGCGGSVQKSCLGISGDLETTEAYCAKRPENCQDQHVVIIKPIKILNAGSEQVDEVGPPLYYFAAPGISGPIIYGADLIALALDLAEPYTLTKADGLLAVDYVYHPTSKNYDIGYLYVGNQSNHLVVVGFQAEIYQAGDLPGSGYPEIISKAKIGIVQSGDDGYFPVNIHASGITDLTVFLTDPYGEAYQIRIPSLGSQIPDISFIGPQIP